VTSATSNHHNQHHGRGVALCLLSAVGFGLMAIFAKEAFRSDVSVTTLLAVRFTLAACAFWVIIAARRARATTSEAPTRRIVLVGLALGGVGYAAQSGAFFGALTHIDASLAALLLYTYPALVFGIAIVLGRRAPFPEGPGSGADRPRVIALGLATAGAALVLAGGGAGALDPLGVVLALTAAVLYSVYILVSERVVGHIDAFLLGALITTGAAVTLSIAGLVSGSLRLDFEPAGWAWIAALGLGSTVIAISAFLAGLNLVGPATAAIVSTIEPVVTVALAMAFFAERLGAVQVVGGVLVLTAVVLLAAKVRRDVPSTEPTAAAAAGAIASEPARG
jgi:drug/metabolite transporter (DMT)-like permease